MNADWAAYDEPVLLERISQSLGRRREVLVRVEGLRCMACVRRLIGVLPQVEVQADLVSGRCALSWDPAEQPLSVILQQIEASGFRPFVLGGDADMGAQRQIRRAELRRLGVALLFGMQVMMLASADYFGVVEPGFDAVLRYAQWMLATPVALYAGWPFLLLGWRGLCAGAPTMDSPIALAITVAYLASALHTLQGVGAVYFDSVVMFVLLLSLARMAEQRGRALAAQRTRQLAATMPLVATRETAQGSESVPASALAVDDVLIVGPGAAVPADGCLQSLSSEFDESIITGEAEPRTRRQDEPIWAGSINLGSAAVRVRLTAVGENTQLHGISQLAERALKDRSIQQLWADQIARYFIAAVLALAVLGFAWQWMMDGAAFETALAVLVVTCPCALSLATPTAVAAAMTALARHQVLLVRGNALLQLHQIDTVCLDKTGTLTSASMELQQLEPLADLPGSACREIAAALEAGIDHPVARAFAGEGATLNVADRSTRPGGGVAGRVDGDNYSLEPASAVPGAGSPGGLRYFELWRGPQRVARFTLREQLRSGARVAVDSLRKLGLELEMLSGDRSWAAQGIGAALGIERIQANLRPDDKLARVRWLRAQGHRVLAVGDGINDAPLLAAADVSVGMASGTALAQSHGDAILLGDQLTGLSALFAVAARTRRIVKQNLTWALLYNVTMVPLALSGVLTPWLAALGMGSSSLLVTLNALRLLARPEQSQPLRSGPEVVPA